MGSTGAEFQRLGGLDRGVGAFGLAVLGALSQLPRSSDGVTPVGTLYVPPGMWWVAPTLVRALQVDIPASVTVEFAPGARIVHARRINAASPARPVLLRFRGPVTGLSPGTFDVSTGSSARVEIALLGPLPAVSAAWWGAATRTDDSLERVDLDTEAMREAIACAFARRVDHGVAPARVVVPVGTRVGGPLAIELRSDFASASGDREFVVEGEGGVASVAEGDSPDRYHLSMSHGSSGRPLFVVGGGGIARFRGLSIRTRGLDSAVLLDELDGARGATSAQQDLILERCVFRSITNAAMRVSRAMMPVGSSRILADSCAFDGDPGGADPVAMIAEAASVTDIEVRACRFAGALRAAITSSNARVAVEGSTFSRDWPSGPTTSVGADGADLAARPDGAIRVPALEFLVCWSNSARSVLITERSRSRIRITTRGAALREERVSPMSPGATRQGTRTFELRDASPDSVVLCVATRIPGDSGEEANLSSATLIPLGLRTE